MRRPRRRAGWWLGTFLATLLGAVGCTPLVADSGPPPLADAGSGDGDARPPGLDAGDDGVEAGCVACTPGATGCSADAIVTCVSTGPGCAGWFETSSCGIGECVLDVQGSPRCQCVPGSFCQSQQQVGTQCESPGGFVTCALDPSGCYLQVGEAVACPSGEACVGSAPAAGCSPECQDQCAGGQTTCNGGGVASCTLQPSGCYAWGAPAPCPQGQVCSGTPHATCRCAAGSTCGALRPGARDLAPWPAD